MKKLVLLQYIVFTILFSHQTTLAIEFNTSRSDKDHSAHQINFLQDRIFNATYSSILTLDKLNNNILCQQSDGTYKKSAIRNIINAIASMKSSSDPATVDEGKHLENLAFKINPIIYFKNGNTTLIGESSPVVIDTDVASIFKLYEENSLYRTVEIITIRVENESELSAIIDLTNINGFRDLKYVYFLCTFNICPNPGCEAGIISQMIQGNESSNAIIYFNVSIPE